MALGASDWIALGAAVLSCLALIATVMLYKVNVRMAEANETMAESNRMMVDTNKRMAAASESAASSAESASKAATALVEIEEQIRSESLSAHLTPMIDPDAEPTRDGSFMHTFLRDGPYLMLEFRNDGKHPARDVAIPRTVRRGPGRHLAGYLAIEPVIAPGGHGSLQIECISYEHLNRQALMHFIDILDDTKFEQWKNEDGRLVLPVRYRDGLGSRTLLLTLRLEWKASSGGGERLQVFIESAEIENLRS